MRENWLEWTHSFYIPEMLATGCFEHCRLTRLDEDENSGFQTYRMDFICSGIENLDRFKAEFAPGLDKELRKKFKGKYSSMSTLYHLIDEMKK